MQLQPPLPLEGLVEVALEAQEALGKWEDSEEGGTKQEVAALLCQLLQQRAEQLRDWFAIDVDEGESAPALLRVQMRVKAACVEIWFTICLVMMQVATSARCRSSLSSTCQTWVSDWCVCTGDSRVHALAGRTHR